MILKTDEIKTFSNEDVKGFLTELEGTVKYELVNKNELRVGEVIDCPISPECYEKAPIATIGVGSESLAFMRLDGSKSFIVKQELSEQMREAMEASRLVIGIGKEETATPLAINALNSAVSQAIGGKSSVLCQTEDKSVSSQMRTEVKVAILNEFLSLRKDKAKVYTCDGMVRYVASDNYVYLPITELIEGLEDVLRNTYPNAEMLRASVSHQYVEVIYRLNDPVLRDEVANILGQAGVTASYEPALLFCTSNTGECGANLHPVLIGSRGDFLTIEEPETMEHVGSASIEKFCKNAEAICALFKATPDRLEALASVGLSRPGKAYRNVAYKANFPVSSYAEYADDFETVYGNMATALDLYVELTGRLCAYADEKKMDAFRRTKYLNSLSKYFLSVERLKECDVDIVFSEM